jgi:hypothetical protein
MTRVDVDTGCMEVYDRQLRRFGVKLPLQLLALLTVQAIVLQPLESGLLSVGHGILPIVLDFARLGSVGDHFTISPAGSSRPFASQLATKYSIAATEVRLSEGHNGTKKKNDHSLPSVASLSMLHSPP